MTDSRYEIAVKTEVNNELFKVSTKMESIKTILEEMADQENDGKDTTGGELRVGIDGHLFTKTAID